MYKKHGKFVARWTRPDGGRSIKTFPTRKAAKAYATRMRRESANATKKAPAKAKASRRSRRPGRKTRRPTNHTASSPTRSSPPQAT
jgi:hypothetical protein